MFSLCNNVLKRSHGCATLAPPGPGDSLALCARAGLLELAVAPEPMLELWFDGADGSNRTDFTGHGLPLVVYCQ